jgi:hypothetical protein
MITEFEIKFYSKSGHSYGTYTCPQCHSKIESRLSASYLKKIKSCMKCSSIAKRNKFLSEDKFSNGKPIPKNCRKCNILLHEKNRARNSKSGKLWCICKKCYSSLRKEYRSKEKVKLKNKEYALKRRENKWNHVLFSLIRRRYPQTNLTPEYIQELWNKQNGLCYWFKIPMTITYKSKYPSKPSIDRLDNSKPYTIENCVLCCYSANIGRNVNNVNDWILFIDSIKKKIIEEYENTI